MQRRRGYDARVSLMGTAVLGAVCMLGAACTFDPGGANQSYGGEPDAAMPPAPPVDAGEIVPTPDAAPPAEAHGQVHCRRVTSAPELDGRLDEWPQGGRAGFDMGHAAQLAPSAFYVPSMTVELRCAHDASQIYFAIHVTDDVRVVDSIDLLDDDGFSLYLDAHGDASGAFGEDDHDLVVRADGTWNDYASGAAHLTLDGVVLADPAADGFTAEIAIAKASLGTHGVLPAQLGFDLALTDDDGLGAFAYGLWFLSNRQSCTACCPASNPAAWCDTTTYGSLLLDL
jgi:Carbohydrate family 9 binding domain-like